jgi:HK97 family phage prohead protease
MGAALFNHNPNAIVGSLKDARIEKKTGRAKLFFDPDQDAQKIAGKVESGSLRGVSVGYIVHKFKKLDEKEEWQGYTGPAYIATKWEPYEISLTPIPADSSVGIGRDLARSLEGIEIEESDLSNFRKEEGDMEPEEVKRIFAECLAAALPGMVTQIKGIMVEDAKPKLRITAEDGLSLLGRAGAISPEVKGKAADMILGGKTKEEVTAYLFDEFTRTKKADAKDAGGDGTDGSGIPNAGEPKARINSFKDLSDDDFFGGLAEPHGTII